MTFFYLYCTFQDKAKRIIEDADGIAISRKKMKKLRRYLRRPTKPDIVNRNRDICTNDVCPNPCVSMKLLC